MPVFVQRKRELATRYLDWAKACGVEMVSEPVGAHANYWLNALLSNSEQEREAFLQASNAQGVMTRPLWELMVELPMFKHCQRDALTNSYWLAERVVNVPSSVVF
jgi:dTDP-4-amino-4,6-dideoxygalactose transaminase